jgi:hypothetical protein
MVIAMAATELPPVLAEERACNYSARRANNVRASTPAEMYEFPKCLFFIQICSIPKCEVAQLSRQQKVLPFNWVFHDRSRIYVRRRRDMRGELLLLACTSNREAKEIHNP